MNLEKILRRRPPCQCKHFMHEIFRQRQSPSNTGRYWSLLRKMKFRCVPCIDATEPCSSFQFISPSHLDEKGSSSSPEVFSTLFSGSIISVQLSLFYSILVLASVLYYSIPTLEQASYFCCKRETLILLNPVSKETSHIST